MGHLPQFLGAHLEVVTALPQAPALHEAMPPPNLPAQPLWQIRHPPEVSPKTPPLLLQAETSTWLYVVTAPLKLHVSSTSNWNSP